MAYTRQYTTDVGWENTPSVATPINATNLNKMDDAIGAIDAAVYNEFIVAEQIATAAQVGRVMPDDNTIKINVNGKISSNVKVCVTAQNGTVSHISIGYVPVNNDILIIRIEGNINTSASTWAVQMNDVESSTAVTYPIYQQDGSNFNAALSVGSYLMLGVKIIGAGGVDSKLIMLSSGTGSLPIDPLPIVNGGTGNTVGYILTGLESGATAGFAATAEGAYNTPSGYCSHAEGSQTTASGDGSHAEGGSTTASGNSAHAEGYGTTASGNYSHAAGYGTIAGRGSQTAIGKYNSNQSDTFFEVGNGAGPNDRSNALEVHSNGNLVAGGDIVAGGTITDGNGRSIPTIATAQVAGLTKPDGVTTVVDANGVISAKYIRAGQAANTSAGTYATIEGLDNTVTGTYAHAEGTDNTASGNTSHAEGGGNVASGLWAHAEGTQTIAGGGSLSASHAEGYDTQATGETAHSEGSGTRATGAMAHAEGDGTTASGAGAHAEGEDTTASGDYSHAGGGNTVAARDYQTVIGHYNDNKSTLFEIGNGTENNRSNAFEVYPNGDIVAGGTITDGNGNSIPAIATTSVAGKVKPDGTTITIDANGVITATGGGGLPETPLSIAHGGTGNTVGYIRTGLASGETAGTKATAEGYDTVASGDYCHAEGENTSATGDAAHVEGVDNLASGYGAHAEGFTTVASGSFSHSEGGMIGSSSAISGRQYTEASGDGSHAEGIYALASARASHAEGKDTTASEDFAHAEGSQTTASGSQSHAEGYLNTASGNSAHAEGARNTASGAQSHAGGRYNTAGYDQQTVVGRFNDNKSDTLFEVGNGTATDARSNAFEVKANGNLVAGGTITDGSGNSIPAIATTSVAGKVKPDGTSITVDNDGTIHGPEVVVVGAGYWSIVNGKATWTGGENTGSWTVANGKATWVPAS